MYGLEPGIGRRRYFQLVVKYLTPAQYAEKGDAHNNLTHAAERLLPGESGLLASIGTTAIARFGRPVALGPVARADVAHHAPEIYRALVEATAFAL